MTHPLKKAISDSIAHYLQSLDRHESAENLHALIIGECERLLITQALQHNHNNQSHTAKWLGITRNTLKKKMLEYGLYEPPAPKPEPPKRRRKKRPTAN